MGWMKGGEWGEWFLGHEESDQGVQAVWAGRWNTDDVISKGHNRTRLPPVVYYSRVTDTVMHSTAKETMYSLMIQWLFK